MRQCGNRLSGKAGVLPAAAAAAFERRQLAAAGQPERERIAITCYCEHQNTSTRTGVGGFARGRQTRSSAPCSISGAREGVAAGVQTLRGDCRGSAPAPCIWRRGGPARWRRGAALTIKLESEPSYLLWLLAAHTRRQIQSICCSESARIL